MADGKRGLFESPIKVVVIIALGLLCSCIAFLVAWFLLAVRDDSAIEAAIFIGCMIGVGLGLLVTGLHRDFEADD